ncbi:hypothetical protein BDW66DRAFT_154233 [Aspergillus desertorum]
MFPALGPASALLFLTIGFPITTAGPIRAFATTSSGGTVQVRAELDLNDALPGPFSDWVADEPSPWAPNALQWDDGTSVMQYSAIPHGDQRGRCLDVATILHSQRPGSMDTPARLRRHDGGGRL